MSTNRKSMIVFGLAILIGLSLVWWLISWVSDLRLNRRQILFEVWHGSVWTGSVTGFFIDSDGSVYTFSEQSRNPIERLFRTNEHTQPPYTTSDLFEYYGDSSQFVGKVHISKLNVMEDLIQPASMGPMATDDPLTPSDCASRDAGIYTYVAYLYDPNHKTHTPVDLYTMGDFQKINLSEEGRRLHQWLETLCFEDEYFSPCNPPSYICRP